MALVSRIRVLLGLSSGIFDWWLLVPVLLGVCDILCMECSPVLLVFIELYISQGLDIDGFFTCRKTLIVFVGFNFLCLTHTLLLQFLSFDPGPNARHVEVGRL